MAGLSAEPYKGTRDFYPEDMRIRDYIFSTWRHVVESYGYEAYDAPLLEPLDVYAAKSGQELVNEQTYQFTDRGDRRVAIRPELTPSVSRMIARKRQEVAFPARWYNIGQFMRYERPQRGREREFWQLNVDIFGVNGSKPEAEIITLGSQILQSFGADEKMYVIRINNRKVINFMMAHYLGLDTVQAQLMIKLFDRKGKIPHEAFRDQAIEIFGDAAASDGLKKIAELLAAKSMADLPESIRDSDAVREVQDLFTLLEQAGITNARFDITLMRGLDYYTGTVFEFFDTHPENNRSLFGGGRYDGLVGLFGAEPVSAVGMAPGYSMTELFLTAHNLLPVMNSSTELYMVVLPDADEGAATLAKELRQQGVKVEVDITERKVDKQLKTAIKKQIPYVIFVGESELKSKVYPLKSTADGSEEKLSFERLVSKILDRRTRSHAADDDVFDIG
ncbi:MAG TPA: histidine--tRNA ligase [Patescibacteria group bacterium]|jgi:histidyl-tRNA synthetase|nr:histidine--tRNA ligase [Patescibacteria group bacterium]